MILTWEKIDEHHQRTSIHGGWLVKTYEDVYEDRSAQGSGMVCGWQWRISMCFVPDPNHEWK